MLRNLDPIKKDKQFKSGKYVFQTYDIEANFWTNYLVSGFYDGENYVEYRNIDEFIDFLNNSEKSLNVFSHFGGGYDMLFIIQALLKNNVEIIKITPRGSLILSMKVQGIYKQHTFRDSSSLLPFSLDSLTRNFNVETKKGHYDHSLNRGYNQELADYLKSDTIGLYQVLEKYFNSELVRKAGPATTLASQAQKILRTYLDDSIISPSDSINEFIRQSCHGGRTEIFKSIGKKIYEFDVNSLYPYVMSINDFPSGRAVKTFHFKKDKLGVYEVEVNCPDMHIPIIPTKIDKKLLFPKGKFKTFITSAEILYAEKLGYKFKIIKGYYFTESKQYFKNFVADLYAIRQNSDKGSVDNILAKLLLNSSYGKFLIKPDKENLILDKTANAVFFRDVEIEGKTYEIFKEDIKLNSFVHTAIGSFILAYARLHMHRLMLPIDKHVYYTDTDSIWTDIKLESSNKIGELKLEKPKDSKSEYYDQVCFLLPKTYIAETINYKKIAMKGFDSRKIKHFNFKDFQNALIGEIKLKVEHDASIYKLKSALKYNQVLKRKEKFIKQINSRYNKRVLNLKNNTSEAIKL